MSSEWIERALWLKGVCGMQAKRFILKSQQEEIQVSGMKGRDTLETDEKWFQGY